MKVILDEASGKPKRKEIPIPTQVMKDVTSSEDSVKEEPKQNTDAKEATSVKQADNSIVTQTTNGIESRIEDKGDEIVANDSVDERKKQAQKWIANWKKKSEIQQTVSV